MTTSPGFLYPSWRLRAMLLTGALAACGDSSGADELEGSETTSGTSAPVPAGSSSAADSLSSVTTTGDTTGDVDPTEASTGTTGDRPELAGSVELIVRDYYDSPTPGYFHWSFEGATARPGVRTHGDTDGTWELGIPLPQRQVAYLVNDHPISELHLGSLDDALPAPTQTMALAPAGPIVDKLPRAIADERAVLYLSGERLWRVDVDDTGPSDAVAVADPWDESLLESEIDPAGRYVLVHVRDDVAEALDVVRACLVTPDLEATEPVTAVSPGGSARFVDFALGGDAAFFQTTEGTTDNLLYAELANPGGSGAIEIMAIAEPTELASTFYWGGARPHASTTGVVFATTQGVPGLTSQYVGIDAGTPMPPLDLHADTDFTVYARWSPDGRWLQLETRQPDDTEHLALLYFGDGHTPSTYPLLDFPIGPGGSGLFAPNSQTFYVWADPPDAGGEGLYAYQLDPTGPSAPTLVTSLGGIRDFSPDSNTLLCSGPAATGPALFTIDVSGAMPGPAVELPVPAPPGRAVSFPEFGPNGDYVAYETDDAFFGPYHLFVFHVDAPEAAVEVTGNLGRWEWITSQ